MTKLHLCGTGGTLAMGYVPASFLKTIEPETYQALAEGEFLYPLYDIRHFILAAKICEKVQDPIQRGTLLSSLVDTKKHIVPLLLAKKQGISLETYESALDQSLEVIASDAGVGTIASILLDYGIEHAENSKPYYIDSTDFSLTAHYPKLYNTAEKFFTDSRAIPDDDTHETAKVLMVIGGTDTKEIYANLLSKDLMRRGMLAPTASNAVFFLSSMASFGENPERIGNYFCAALSLTQKHPKGAFALITKTENASEVDVLNVGKKFSKISSKLVASFRSDNVIESLKRYNHYHCSATMALPSSDFTPIQEEVKELECIAPPIMAGNDPAAIAHFMQAVLDDPHTPIKGIIIEGIPGFSQHVIAHAKLRQTINSLTKELSERGITVYCLNEHSYDDNKKAFAPAISQSHWAYSQQLQKLQDAGAVVVDGHTAYGCYTSATLGLLPTCTASDKPIATSSSPIIATSVPALAIRYIPDPVAFEYALDLASSFTQHIIISALPDNAIPQRHAEKIKALCESGTVFHIGFRYNGTTYQQGDVSFVEGTAHNDYAAHLFPGKNDNIKYHGALAPTSMLQCLTTSTTAHLLSQ